jgi:hypothetical protein
MDIKIHIFSNTNAIGKVVYFVYKTGEEDGYVCASLDWSPYLINKYRLFDAKNKIINNCIGKFEYIPYNEIDTVIKRVIKEQSNIDVNNITYCNKNKLDKFIESTQDYVYSRTS